jgi:hypothetical protein
MTHRPGHRSHTIDLIVAAILLGAWMVLASLTVTSLSGFASPAPDGRPAAPAPGLP